MACNTVSAVALDILRVELDIPVLGVIEPGAAAGVRASRLGRIAVIATAGTIASGAYARSAAQLDSRVEVFGEPAPLLVPLVEEGWTEGDVPMQVVRRYLQPLVKGGARRIGARLHSLSTAARCDREGERAALRRANCGGRQRASYCRGTGAVAGGKIAGGGCGAIGFACPDGH